MSWDSEAVKWALGIVVLIAALVVAVRLGTCATYKLLHVYVPDPSLAVTRDMADDRVRLTSRDLTNQGAELATRTFIGTTGVLCEELSAGSLVCEIDHGEIIVLDARTLADKTDVTELIERALPSADVGADYRNVVVHPDGTIDVPIGETADARVDLATGRVTTVPVTPPRGRHRSRCIGYTNGTDHQGLRWKIDGDRLVRERIVAEAESAVAEAEVPSVPAPIANASILDCGTYQEAVLAISYTSTSQLARLDDSGRARWVAELAAHPDDVFVLGDWILVTTGEASRRLIAVDLLTGAIRWVSG